MVKKKGRLCNQGCGTRLFFQKDEKGKNRPYNMLDKEKHVCPMLEMAKFWGGHYDTIPMGLVYDKIEEAYHLSSMANESRNIDDILQALQRTVDSLQYVVFKMDEQKEKNMEWDNNLEAYKKKLVEDQLKREQQEEDENLQVRWTDGTGKDLAV